MTAPGWYAAHGDPPGTHRYWDGTQWVGDAVRVQTDAPAQAGGFDLIAPADNAFGQSYGAFDIVAISDAPTPTPAVSPVTSTPAELTFLPGLKVLAVIISVVKAIPLVISGLLLRWVADQGSRLDDVLGPGNAELLRDSINTLYVIFAVMAGLLVVQLIAALSERPLFLFVIALVLTLLDLLSLVQQAVNGSLPMLVLTLAVTAVQAGMTFWAWTVFRNRPGADAEVAQSAM